MYLIYIYIYIYTYIYIYIYICVCVISTVCFSEWACCLFVLWMRDVAILTLYFDSRSHKNSFHGYYFRKKEEKEKALRVLECSSNSGIDCIPQRLHQWVQPQQCIILLILWIDYILYYLSVSETTSSKSCTFFPTQLHSENNRLSSSGKI